MTVSHCASFSIPSPPRRPSRNFPVVDLDDVLATLDAEGFQRVSGEHAHLGIRRDALGTDGIGVELRELAEAAGAGLLVADTEPVA